jgi:hyperosmotically inducible protein
LIRQIPGVKSVENNITIATDGTMKDDEIQYRIMEHLHKGPHKRELENVRAHVKGGVVTLIGKVNTLSDKTNAKKMAERTPGIRDVINNISIQSQGMFTDDKIKSKINQLFSTVGIDSKDIELSVNKGNVTLSGFVKDMHQMELAEELTMDVESVIKVKNRLKLWRDNKL